MLTSSFVLYKIADVTDVFFLLCEFMLLHVQVHLNFYLEVVSFEITSITTLLANTKLKS